VSDGDLAVDLLVIGGGMAGLTAASYAATHGAAVMLVEKAHEVGGSAAISDGALWTAGSYETIRLINPQGDPRLNHTLIQNYPEAVEWVRSTGVECNGPDREAWTKRQAFDAIGMFFDVFGYLQRCKDTVLSKGGWISTDATVEHLLIEDGAVKGAAIKDRDGETSVQARWTLLASGGFQADPESRRRYIGPHAGDLILRSNPNSTGDGLRLALSAGAGLAGRMDGFYGHLVPSPLANGLQPSDYYRFVLNILVRRGVLLDARGQRFVDESIGDYHAAHAVARLPGARAVLVGDAQARQDDFADVRPTVGNTDRPAEAAQAGARVAEAETLGELAAKARAWGYNGVERTLLEFNDQVGSEPECMQPLRLHYQRPLDRAPFFAMEVQPVITFTWGGIRIDEHARVLNEAGRPIPGLLAAGADSGGHSYNRYIGGLAPACVFGLQAALQALSE